MAQRVCTCGSCAALRTTGRRCAHPTGRSKHTLLHGLLQAKLLVLHSISASDARYKPEGQVRITAQLIAVIMLGSGQVLDDS